jgi:putative transposase
MATEDRPIHLACRCLDVAASGFYEWRSRPPSKRAVRHAWLTDVIGQIHTASNGTYGAPRVTRS